MGKSRIKPSVSFKSCVILSGVLETNDSLLRYPQDVDPPFVQRIHAPYTAHASVTQFTGLTVTPPQCLCSGDSYLFIFNNDPSAQKK